MVNSFRIAKLSGNYATFQKSILLVNNLLRLHIRQEKDTNLSTSVENMIVVNCMTYCHGELSHRDFEIKEISTVMLWNSHVSSILNGV